METPGHWTLQPAKGHRFSNLPGPVPHAITAGSRSRRPKRHKTGSHPCVNRKNRFVQEEAECNSLQNAFFKGVGTMREIRT